MMTFRAIASSLLITSNLSSTEPIHRTGRAALFFRRHLLLNLLLYAGEVPETRADRRVGARQRLTVAERLEAVRAKRGRLALRLVAVYVLALFGAGAVLRAGFGERDVSHRFNPPLLCNQC